jgi:putative transcriptional regulator
MSQHHPSINILTEYCAGSLGTAQALAVTAHLHYCHSCRCQVENLNKLNAAFFAEGSLGKTRDLSNPKPVDEQDHASTQALLRSTFDKIDTLEHATRTTKPNDDTRTDGFEHSTIANKIRKDLPPAIAKLVGKPRFLQWKTLSPSMKAAKLATGQSECEVSLIKIKAGGKVLEHDHKGNEYTVVLRGAFSDQDGIYSAGDFIHRQSHEVHSPNATSDADCLCLTVIDAPLKFTGLIGYVINPFMKLQPN